MIKILKHLRLKDLLQILVCVGLIVLQVWLDLKMPEYTNKITQLIKTEGSTMGQIWEQGGYMLLCALGSLASAITVGFFAARIGASFSRRLRGKMFAKVDSFSMGEITRFSTASLITRSTNDITQVQMLITMGMQLFIKAPIMAVWAIVKISGKGFEWSIATIVAVLVLLVMLTLIITVILPKMKKIQSLTDNLNKVARENLSGLPVVRAYNAENYQEAKFEKVNNDLTKTHLFTARGMSVMMPMMTFVMSSLTLIIYWIGMVLITNLDASNFAGAGERAMLFFNMMEFSAYAMQVIMAFLMIAMIFIILPRATVSAKRINEVLDTVPSIKNGTVTDGEAGRAGEVVFKNVSFKYPGAADYVIKDVSFSVNRGETIAFIGSTGSGKSTLINLVPRFYDATEGEVLVDGVNIKDYTLEALHNKIGYIPQKAVLFSGTVSDNVAFGDNGREPATEDDIKNAVRIAQGAEFIENMTGQYEGQIARGGTNISGGQKQRLAIARAVCRKPEIYIFDDSFSALDYKTDRTLRSALKKETDGVTSMIVAQRIGTIMDADKIVVLDEGRLVGVGTHRELLANCDVYKEIAYSQLSQEELA